MEHDDQNRENPEFGGGTQEERRETYDAKIRDDRGHDHRFASESPGKPPVGDCAREGDELGHQQGKHQLRGVDAKLRTV